MLAIRHLKKADFFVNLQCFPEPPCKVRKNMFSVFLCQRCRAIRRENLVTFSERHVFRVWVSESENFTKFHAKNRVRNRKVSLREAPGNIYKIRMVLLKLSGKAGAFFGAKCGTRI